MKLQMKIAQSNVICDQWNHIDCRIGISIRKYEKLKPDSSPWYCPTCLSEFPFFQMNDKELKSFLKISKTSATQTQVTSKTNLRTKELIKSFKQLKQMLEESENPVSCDYYDVHDLNKIQIHQHDLSIIHLNISSLASYIHDLKLFLSVLKVSFDIICTSESRISNTIFQPSTSIYQVITLNTLPLNVKQEEP